MFADVFPWNFNSTKSLVIKILKTYPSKVENADSKKHRTHKHTRIGLNKKFLLLLTHNRHRMLNAVTKLNRNVHIIKMDISVVLYFFLHHCACFTFRIAVFFSPLCQPLYLHDIHAPHFKGLSLASIFWNMEIRVFTQFNYI